MNETLNVNLNNLTEEERNTLLALVEKSTRDPEPKVWKPKHDDEYFYINAYGETRSFLWKDNDDDEGSYIIGNCFRTKEEAEFTIEKLKVIAELKQFAQEYNTEEIDHSDPHQYKYYFYYSHIDKKINIAFMHGVTMNLVYFTSREIAEQALREIGEERIKKYYLEVE